MFRAIERLDLISRNVIESRVTQEGSMKELADAPNVSVAKVKTRLYRTRKPRVELLGGGSFDNGSESSAALSPRALKAIEYCLGGRENRNHLRISIEHSKGEGAIDDAKYRRRRRSFLDC